MGVFFALPHACPTLYDKANKSPLARLARFMYELVQLVFSSVLDKSDIERAEYLGHELLQAVPVIFPDFGQKPKFHYSFAHIGTTLQRHGPSPFWSGFAFESRLGDLKRACLLVSNNHGVAARGGDLALEMFAVQTRSSQLAGPIVPLIDWIMSLDFSFGSDASTGMDSIRRYFRDRDISLTGVEPVRSAKRYEGACCAFNSASFLSLSHCERGVDSPDIVYVENMCQILGIYTSSSYSYIYIYIYIATCCCCCCCIAVVVVAMQLLIAVICCMSLLLLA